MKAETVRTRITGVLRRSLILSFQYYPKNNFGQYQEGKDEKEIQTTHNFSLCVCVLYDGVYRGQRKRGESGRRKLYLVIQVERKGIYHQVDGGLVRPKRRSERNYAERRYCNRRLFLCGRYRLLQSDHRYRQYIRNKGRV